MSADKPKKGFVRVRGPAAKVVAEAPADQEIREHLEEARKNDGFPGSCGI
jgi:hypothetical protein